MSESFGYNPEFLKERHPGLAKSKEVKGAAGRTERRTGKTPAQIAAESAPEGETIDSQLADIQNYLDRFKEIIERPDPKAKERGIKALKKVLTDRYVVRVEDIPESYWQAQMRIVRERGMAGDWQDLSEEEKLKIKQEHLAQTKEDQKGSLEEWIDYLASDKSSYLPDYLKYWAFAGMLRLERYEKGDKEKGVPGRFPERPTGRQRSIKMFPEVNERGLEFIAKAYKAQSEGKSVVFGRHDIPQEAQQKFLEQLAKKDFRQVYGWAQEYLPPISEEEMKNTEGEWRTYEQDSDSEELTKNLRGKGSGWCIAGKEMARQYLEQGKLHIFYSKDRDGALTVPRIVIVEQNNRVTEVRGIEWEENVDEYIKPTSIIGNKLKELPGGEVFFETDQDTKKLTAIDKKMSAGQEITRDELVFLYEINRSIKHFGYKKDPRIDEIRKRRNPREDAPIVFDCRPEEIAGSRDEINENTKVYIGNLSAGILDLIEQYNNIEYVYTRFPDRKKLLFRGFTTGPSEQEGEAKSNEFERKKIEYNKTVSDPSLKIQTTDYARDIFRKIGTRKHPAQKNRETFSIIVLKVRDLFQDENLHTTEEIYRKAQEFGLELCPPETGPDLRQKYTSQPLNEWFVIAMKQIVSRGGSPHVFRLVRRANGLWLRSDWAPYDEWHPDDAFVFRLRKLDSKS